MIRRLLYPLLLVLLLSLSGIGCSKTDKGEETAAQIEAAMMQGREAARIFVNRNWPDSTELRARLNAVRAHRSHYDTLGLRRSAEAFDSGFVSTIRTINPEIAKQIK